MFRKRMNIKISRSDQSKPELIAGKVGKSMTHLFEEGLNPYPRISLRDDCHTSSILVSMQKRQSLQDSQIGSKQSTLALWVGFFKLSSYR